MSYQDEASTVVATMIKVLLLAGAETQKCYLLAAQEFLQFIGNSEPKVKDTASPSETTPENKRPGV